MISLQLIGIAIPLATVSGLSGLALPRTSTYGEKIAAGLQSAATILGLTGATMGLFLAEPITASFPWPAVGGALIGLDGLSAFFLVPIFLMGGLGSIYGLGYWPQKHHQHNGRQLRLFWGFLIAGLGLLVISRHALSFLLGWEIMALSAFFLISTEDDVVECRKAAWIYLISTHIGTLTLFGLFSLWRYATGSFELRPIAPGLVSFGMLNLLFCMALLGFGMKAGMMPLHFWLPSAHATSPSHVSAMLSGVVLKMGIYGLARFIFLCPDPPSAWGGLILLLGTTSALLGVVFAIGQHDLKRLLAYHSVENIGIILMGLGIAMLGRSTGRVEWVVLGLAGCLLHVWNHSLFKCLLFLCAGAVVHSTKTREIDRMGGLAKSMPWTAAAFLGGAVAICGLPPMNGFVSEMFVYLGLLHGLTLSGNAVPVMVVTVPVLAMTGALALACFVKVYGAVFLGNSRAECAANAHESPLSMRAPMFVLLAICLAIGLAPAFVCRPLASASAAWLTRSGPARENLAMLAPLHATSILATLLAALIGVLTLAFSSRIAAARDCVTWDCGYASPTARMQYTASSFARMIVTMFRGVLAPREILPRIDAPFPSPVAIYTHVDELVLDRALMPFGRDVAQRFQWFHRFQQGLTQYYVLYILITLIAMLVSLMPLDAYIARLWLR